MQGGLGREIHLPGYTLEIQGWRPHAWAHRPVGSQLCQAALLLPAAHLAPPFPYASASPLILGSTQTQSLP